ncbi:MAG: hypothetical protein AAF961_05060 [Planctomycetota bacterium]
MTQIEQAVGRVEKQSGDVVDWLHAELGYQAPESGGGVLGRRLTLVEVAAQECREILRGTGNELGLMQRVALLWWSFPIVVSISSTALGTIVGYGIRSWLGSRR